MSVSPPILAKPKTAAPRLDGLLRTPVGRLLVPSFSDLFFIATFCWLFLVGPFGWQGLLDDGDTGWHIRTGQYIVEHGRVPVTDLFSFSRPGAAWYAWEWLADVIDYALFAAAGLKGVALFAGTLIALYTVVLFRTMVWRGGNLFAALLISLLGVGAASLHYLARPHLFTLLFFAIAIWAVEADRRTPRARVWLLVPLTILWANLHAGFTIFLLYLGILVVGSTIEMWLRGDRNWSAYVRYATLLVLCTAASVVNPYGLELHRHILAFLGSGWIRTMIQEFQSPNFSSENTKQFEILLFSGLMITGFLLRKKRVTEVLWILCFAHLALTSARHITVFVTVAAPLIAVELTSAWVRVVAWSRPKSALRIFEQIAREMSGSLKRTSVWPAVLIAVCIAMGAPIPWPTNFSEKLFPVQIVQRHREQLTESRVLTVDQWADYLIFENYPRQRVYIDGRSDFYGQSIGDEYVGLAQGRFGWEAALAKRNFDLVLAPVEWPLVSLLKLDRNWRVIEDDGRVILFQRLKL